MTETPAPDLRALRELAEAATPGPWALAKWDPKLVLTKRWADDEADPTDRGPWMAANATWEPDAAFIAAANPTAVLALLDRLEAAEARAEENGYRALAAEEALDRVGRTSDLFERPSMRCEIGQHSKCLFYEGCPCACHANPAARLHRLQDLARSVAMDYGSEHAGCGCSITRLIAALDAD